MHGVSYIIYILFYYKFITLRMNSDRCPRQILATYIYMLQTIALNITNVHKKWVWVLIYINSLTERNRPQLFNCERNKLKAYHEEGEFKM